MSEHTTDSNPELDATETSTDSAQPAEPVADFSKYAALQDPKVQEAVQAITNEIKDPNTKTDINSITHIMQKDRSKWSDALVLYVKGLVDRGLLKTDNQKFRQLFVKGVLKNPVPGAVEKEPVDPENNDEEATL